MPPIPVADRLKPFGGPSVWLEFSPLSQHMKSCNLGQGFPDWQPPAFVKEIAAEAIVDPKYFQYARSAGQPQLNETISEIYGAMHGRSICPNREVLVTDGASEAIYLSLLSFVNPGDEVIIIEPFFDIYAGALGMVGGVPRHCPLRPRDGIRSSGEYDLDLDELKALLSPKTKAIILNSPHNPTGKVFSREEYQGIAACLEPWPEVVVISDEVYEHLVFDGASHVPFAQIDGMADRTLSIYSAGKTFSITGWKIGWIVGPQHLMKAVQIAQQWIVFSVATPLQEVVARALKQGLEPYEGVPSYYRWLAGLYEKKRDFLCDGLEQANLRVIRPQGSFFIVAETSGMGLDLKAPPQEVLDFVEKGQLMVDQNTLDDPSYNFCRHLTVSKGVTPIPITAFMSKERKSIGEDFARFAFCKENHVLLEARNRMVAN